jgi:hypothetical protein
MPRDGLSLPCERPAAGVCPYRPMDLLKVLRLRHIVEAGWARPYRSGRSRDWLKFKNPAVPAVKREAEEDWGR